MLLPGKTTVERSEPATQLNVGNRHASKGVTEPYKGLRFSMHAGSALGQKATSAGAVATSVSGLNLIGRCERSASLLLLPNNEVQPRSIAKRYLHDPVPFLD